MWGGWLEAPPTPPPTLRAQPSSPTFKSTNPRDSAWPGTALRTEADVGRSPAPLRGAGPRGRSPEAGGSGSGAAPSGPGRPGGAQPQAARQSQNIPGHTFHRLPPRSLPGPGLKMSGDRAAEAVEMGWLSHGDPWAPHMGDPLGVALTPHLQSDWGPPPPQGGGHQRSLAQGSSLSPHSRPSAQPSPLARLCF